MEQNLGNTGRRMDAAWRQAISEGLKEANRGLKGLNNKAIDVRDGLIESVKKQNQKAIVVRDNVVATAKKMGPDVVGAFNRKVVEINKEASAFTEKVAKLPSVIQKSKLNQSAIDVRDRVVKKVTPQFVKDAQTGAEVRKTVALSKQVKTPKSASDFFYPESGWNTPGNVRALRAVNEQSMRMLEAAKYSSDVPQARQDQIVAEFEARMLAEDRKRLKGTK